MYSTRLLPILTALVAAACGTDSPAAGGGEPVERADVAAAAAGITGADLLGKVAVMAHDSMRGRFTPSPELEETAAWIAGEFQALGLSGGAPDGGFIQRYDVPEDPDGATAPVVVGVLRGSDPGVADEYVVYSAHMDHVGVRSPDESGDSIYNGADDDASGTAAVMEVAEALAALAVPPRRSTAFVLVSGEERGLWGSRAFAADGAIPVEDMVANLNLDMVGRNWSDTIVAIGREHSTLGETLDRVSARHSELNMAAIDDLWPDERFYYRSDHFNFARRGVPVLFFFNGTHEDYHRPSDEVDLIDEEKAARIARLLFYLGLEVGDADEPPRWDPDSYERIVDGGGSD